MAPFSECRTIRLEQPLADVSAFVLSRCAAARPRSILRRLEVFNFRKEVMNDQTTETNVGRVATSQLLA